MKYLAVREGFLNKTDRISVVEGKGDDSNLGRKQELREKDSFARLFFLVGNRVSLENQGVGIKEGARLVGALKTKRINIMW